MTTENQDVRVHVREHYGQIAGSSQPCCGPADCCPSSAAGLYQVSDVQELPAEVTNLSLGCGDPITLAELVEGQVVLDLGSGGGIDCFLAARRVGPGGRVIGVDMTAAMLEKARANRDRLGADNVEFRLGEIEHLPVADGTVDVIISNCVINLSPDKAQVFREAFRVLRPGGKLAVSDMVTDGPLPEALRASLEAWSCCVSGALDVGTLIELMEAAGFVDVRVEPEYLDQAMVAEALEQFGLAAQLETVPRERLEKAVFSARITALKPAA